MLVLVQVKGVFFCEERMGSIQTNIHQILGYYPFNVRINEFLDHYESEFGGLAPNSTLTGHLKATRANIDMRGHEHYGSKNSFNLTRIVRTVTDV